MESTILSNLVFNREYADKVFPYVKEEYFENNAQRVIYDSFVRYMVDYKEPPSMEALEIGVSKRSDLNEKQFEEVNTYLKNLKVDPSTNLDWLVTETEKFCQTKDLYNSIRRSILILEGKDKELDKGSIPDLLSKSLAISFDSNIGHDFFEDLDERYDYYHREDERLAFDLEMLNAVTKGGLPRKSLTMLLACSGAGKSLAMCHFAAANLLHGKNVLYISMEMPEGEVSKRIDANILDITVDDVMDLPKDTFKKRIGRIKMKTKGRLVVKDYPTGFPHAGHFRHLLNELKTKQDFVPDIIYVDYLNICSSSRVKGAAASNSYNLVKAISEEIRGLAMEFDVPIVSASQLNRDAYDNTDVDLTNTSESMGIVHTSDAIFALITSEELENQGKLMIKQLKNRWGDLGTHRRFVVGIERAKMKLYNLDNEEQGKVFNEPTDKSRSEPLSKPSLSIEDVAFT